jgi:uncharacterized protein (DUF1499 family)
MSSWAFWLTVTGAVLVIGGPVLHRLNLLPLAPALLAAPLGIVIALVALVLSVTLLVGGRSTPAGRGTVVGAAAMSALTGIVPILLVLPGLRAPGIHDITTDTTDPPAFVEVVPLRADAQNSLEYGGETVAVAQREAYPDLDTLVVGVPAAQLVEQARDVAIAMGWEVVSADPATGRLEASDTTFWFGFTDDIVVRARPSAGGAEVDVRSVSRVGVSDLGANAARIRAFLERLRAVVDR